MLSVILVSNYSMKAELEDALKLNGYDFNDLMIQDIQHIERYPIDEEYKTIIIQSANAIKKIDSSNNHIYNSKYIFGIGPNCKSWVKKKFSLECIIPEADYSSVGLIRKIQDGGYNLGKTLLLKGIGGKEIIHNYLKETKIDYTVCNVYERVLNLDNLKKVVNMTNKGAIVIGFSKSSIEPLINSKEVNIKDIHFFVLDKSDENILRREQVASLTKLQDIYDINGIVNKIKGINE